MNKEPYQPTKQAEFYCNFCDIRIVDSTKPETGKFFLHFGHSYCQATKQYDGNYTGVMNAVCCVCYKGELTTGN
jgi:hypothetical protein